jgi:flagellar basal-body rod protein FlgF
MESTSNVALSRQNVIERKMSVIANNLANMNTNSFKGEKMMFVDHVVKSRGGERLSGDRVAYVRDLSTIRDLS